MLDSIEIKQELVDGFLLTWPVKWEKDVTMMFVFRKERRLVVSCLVKMDPVEKMICVVANTPKEKVSMVQEIALNLGISKK